MAVMFLVLGLIAVLGQSSEAMKCNGMEDLCDLRFDQVTYPGTHNSGSNKAMYAANPLPVLAPACSYQNQEHSVKQQLKDGIRALDLDLCFRYEYDNRVWTCHVGAYVEPLKDVLIEISDFLNEPENRNEVIFIRFHDADLTEFHDLRNDLTKYFNPEGVQMDDSKPNYPTLKKAIEANKRIFIFVATHTCGTDCKRDNKFVRSVNEYHDTWDTWWSASCHKMPAWTTTKCEKFAKGWWKPLTYVSVFGTWGACNTLVASTCNQYIKNTVLNCHKVMVKEHQTVNVIAVDYYKKSQSVVEVAKHLNELNIAKFKKRK